MKKVQKMATKCPKLISILTVYSTKKSFLIHFYVYWATFGLKFTQSAVIDTKMSAALFLNQNCVTVIGAFVLFLNIFVYYKVCIKVSQVNPCNASPMWESLYR